MKRKSLGSMTCPIARSLERVGDWWNILILRNAFYGLRRFDEFESSLGIATNTLARRLDDMVASGLLERRLYCERPPRHEYLLTDVARDFRPVMLAMLAWGNRHFAPEGVSVDLVDAETGLPVEPVLVDRRTGRPLTDARVVAGLAASETVRALIARQTLDATRPAGAPAPRPTRAARARRDAAAAGGGRP